MYITDRLPVQRGLNHNPPANPADGCRERPLRRPWHLRMGHHLHAGQLLALFEMENQFCDWKHLAVKLRRPHTVEVLAVDILGTICESYMQWVLFLDPFRWPLTRPMIRFNPFQSKTGPVGPPLGPRDRRHHQPFRPVRSPTALRFSCLNLLSSILDLLS